MSRPDHGLVALVKSKTAITDLIGTAPTRFFPRELPQGLGSFPASAFRFVDTDPRDTFEGGSTYDFAFVDIFCYGRNSEDVFNLWAVMRKELEDSVGTFNAVEIDHVWYMPSGVEDYIPELELETKQLELKIAYRRT